MAERGIQTNDLYNLVKPRLDELQSKAYDGDVHFTEEGYEILGQAVANALVPEPATLSLLGIGAVALLCRRRIRRNIASSHRGDSTRALG
jgi:hypothetical protein